MAEFIHINPVDPELIYKLDNLPPTPGICIFIDICDSTQMKLNKISHWVGQINHVFSHCHYLLDPFFPIKSIGDALMFYITDSEMAAAKDSYLEIFNDLCSIASDPHPRTTIGIVACEKAYPLTFISGSKDYYGPDIDLTARLQQSAEADEVVFETRFYNRLKSDYEKSTQKEKYPHLLRICGPWPSKIKGFNREIDLFKVKCLN